MFEVRQGGKRENMGSVSFKRSRVESAVNTALRQELKSAFSFPVATVGLET